MKSNKTNINGVIKICNNIMAEMSLITVCFTGHRCQKLPWGFDENDVRCLKMKKRAKKEIEKAIKMGKTHFISGMAIGFDMICAEIVLELKKDYPSISLECALACKNQDRFWGDDLKQRYLKIIEQADKIRCVYNFYKPGCTQERNRYMINNSSLVIALFNGQEGGTKQTLEYARKNGLKIKIIKP